MVAKKNLEALAIQKQMLLLQSDLHRKLIAIEWQSLSSDWQAQKAAGRSGQIADWLGLAVTPLAGIAIAGGWRKTLRWIACGLSVWRVLRGTIEK